MLKAIDLLKLLKEYDICNLILIPFKVLDLLHGLLIVWIKGPQLGYVYFRLEIYLVKILIVGVLIYA